VDFIWGADTSGSLYGRKAFVQVLNEIKKTLRQFGRRDVRFIQIDTRITRDEVVRASALGKVKFSGGGGTVMNPVFLKLAKEKNRLPFILFTDGEWFGDVDWTKVRFQVLVLLTENGTDRYVKDAPKNVRVVRVLGKREI
jgi:predicted metal-dependent peptidase